MLFHAQERFFERGSDFWTWVQHVGPGIFFGSKLDPQKVNLRRNHFVVGWQGISQDPSEFYYIYIYIYRNHLGRLLCQQPSIFTYFQGISRCSGKLVGPWDLPCVFPIPLRDPVALFPLFGVSRWCHRCLGNTCREADLHSRCS